MRRTMIIGAIGATALTIGLGVGATLAASDPTPTTPTVTMTDAMSGNHMNDIEDMPSMMNGVDVTSMMGAGDMDAMHTAMHDALAGTVEADALAACDTAHDAMTTSSAPATPGMPAGDAAHHPGSQP